MSKTSDLVQLAKHLSFHRVLNITKLYSSFLISRIIKKPIVWGMPFTVSIEPTTACNLSCPECPSGKKEFTRDTGKISVNDNEFLQLDIQEYCNLNILNDVGDFEYKI